MFSKILKKLVLDYKVAEHEKRLNQMSVKIKNLEALVVKVVADSQRQDWREASKPLAEGQEDGQSK